MSRRAGMVVLIGALITGAPRAALADRGAGERDRETAARALRAYATRYVLAAAHLTPTYARQTGPVLFPDQLSLFTGGEITPHVGGFLQVTFDPQSGQIGVDNADFRFATHGSVLSKRATFGLSVNNNPTVQDVWNSTPAWGFPYGSSAVAPAPGAATLIDGTLGQQVAGLTAYTMWNDRVYGEIGVYRSAPLGVLRPLDSTATAVISGVAPYWRLALPNVWGQNYLAIGTYGMAA